MSVVWEFLVYLLSVAIVDNIFPIVFHSLIEVSGAFSLSVSIQGFLTPIASGFQYSSMWRCILLIIDLLSFENASNCEKMLVEFVSIQTILLIKSLRFVLTVRIHPVLDLRRCRVSLTSVHFMDAMSV